ncbi:SAVMC3_10250 family protein [Kitasatospora purpeofusca]|uniref:SAVMC3_10250 family protein n=1 Tax=Kitasatospora purpeofusca TaxID=67352 RepID=UPI0036C2EC9E
MQQEVVYLSQGKLDQFLPRPRRPRLPSLKANISTPLGGINLEASAPDEKRKLTQQLRQVEKQLAKSARSFTTPDLHPGEWVEFTTALRWVTLRGDYRDLVLFVGSNAGPASFAEPLLQRRLLMHGSTRHLRGYPAAPVDGPDLNQLEGWSSAGTMVVTNAGKLVQAMVDAESEGSTAAHMPIGSGVRDLLHALDANNGEIDTAAKVNGYARVSGVLPATATTPECLIASPLIVRYS